MEMPKSLISDKEKTFQYDDSLPSLPLYPLQQTLDRYLESVRPFLDHDEFLQTQAVVQEFGSGVGKQLHNHLMNKSKHSRNWLEKLWEDKVYLEPRMSLAPKVNFSGPATGYFTIWPPEEGSQVKRCALLLWCQLKFWQALRRQEVLVDKADGGRVPWSMHQYQRLFNSCRIPGIDKDQLHYHFKLEEGGPCPPHVVVMCRGRLFVCDVLDGDQEPLTAPEIQHQLQFIRDYCDERPRGPGLGCLTSADRTTWANLRHHLMELHPDHRRHLELIETSLLGIALDDSSPTSYEEISWEGLCGDCTNRWFDKSTTNIVFKNGTVASNSDHSPFEAMVVIMSTYFSLLMVEAAEGKWRGSLQVRPLIKPSELVFHLDDRICKAIHTTTENYIKMGNNIEVLVPVYEGYGRSFMRRHKLHPDAFVQLALQLNYYRMYGKPAPTYETATIRKYYRARTETHRTCTVEAIEWAQAMLDLNSTVERRRQCFRIAHAKHNDLMAAAQQMKGCDRHLMGLYYMAEELGMKVPQIFTDPAYKKSGGGGNYILSTSFVGNTSLLGGVAPMCRHGYGCFYSLQPKTITFYFSAWVEDDDTSVKGFYSNMMTTLDSMHNMLEETKPSKL